MAKVERRPFTNRDRIPRILKELEIVWQGTPQLRLGQLIVVLARERAEQDPFYITDADMLKVLEGWPNRG